MLLVVFCGYPLWKYTTNGSIQCLVNYVQSHEKGKSYSRVIWVIQSALQFDLNNPHKANSKCLYEQQNTVYFITPQNSISLKKLAEHLVSYKENMDIVSCDLDAGLSVDRIRTKLPLGEWIHLCTLHMGKNVKLLIDRGILSNRASFDEYHLPETQVFRHADQYLTVSKSELDWAAQFAQTKQDSDKLSIYYPTRSWWDASWWTNETGKSFYMREKYPNKKLLLYVGRITYQKGIDMLLKIIFPPNVHMCIMSSSEFGDASLIRKCQEKSQADTDSFTWIGPYYGEDKISIMKQCDGVICPSIYEPYGLVGLETILFAKTLLLTSAVDGMMDYLTEGGYVHFDLNVTSIQNAVEQFSRMDESERRAMINRAHFHAMQTIH